jgi:hypothetical protein
MLTRVLVTETVDAEQL